MINFYKIILILTKISRRLYSFFSNLEKKLFQNLNSPQQNQNGVISTTKYDMFKSPGEVYYAQQYLSWIEPALSNLPSNPQVLDLGCGQGRMSITLKKKFPHFSIQGFDLSETAIQNAKTYAEQEKATPIQFSVSDIITALQKMKGNSADIILMTEVTFFFPQWKTSLGEIKRVLKPGGFLFISFRSQYYYLLHSLETGQWDDISTLLEKRSGRLGSSQVEFTWQTSDEIRSLFTSDSSLKLEKLVGVGSLSGCPGDPLSSICIPQGLEKSQYELLMKAERAVAENAVDASRYMLAIVRNF